MSNWNTIDDLRDIFIEKYTDSKLNNELEKACSEEFELMRDYNGRQILELLQNVDDAYGELKKQAEINGNNGVEVEIRYSDQILEVGNTGTTFTKETIERLCLGRASNKSIQNIGNKGTGFRSLLNNAEWIELYSGEFAIRFSEKFAEKCFNQFLHKELLAKQLEAWKKDYPLCFPIMNCPEQIEKIATKFDTLIRIKIKENSAQNENSISRQLEQPFYKSLLFLPNISKILINVDGEQRLAEKIGTANDVVIQQIINSEIKHKTHYYVVNKIVQIRNKDATLVIAVPKNKDYDFKKEKLYCYFPIREFSTPINALIHAPFMTNSSRDNISNDSEGLNKHIFKHVLHFIKEVAEQLANPEHENLALNFVLPKSDHRLWTEELFDLYDDYLHLLSEAKILPTINGEFLSIRDNPKIVSNAPIEFKGRNFKTLLYLKKAEHLEFVRELADFNDYTEIEYTPEDLVNKIDALKVDWDLATIIKIFLWWSRYYADSDVMPELLLDTRNNYVQKTDKVFLPTDGGVSYLPEELSWVKLCIVEQTYVDELVQQIKANYFEEWHNINEKFKADKTGDKRLLATYSTIYLAIEFTEQSSSDLIIGTINRQIDTVEKAKSFINWFFEKYEHRLQSGSELSKLSYKFPDEHGEIKPANKLFLGEHYGHTLGRKLFDNATYTALLQPKELYVGHEIKRFMTFIEKCGVLKYPLIVTGEPLKRQQFNDFLKQKYYKEIDFNINYIKVKKIDQFENVINKLTTAEIVEWIDQDENLLELLHSVKKESNVSKQSNWTGFNFNSNEYLIYLLNTTSWIKLGANKYTPKQIVLYDKLKATIPSLYGINAQQLYEIVGDKLIKLLDFKDSMALLMDEEIKLILKHLPKFDKGEISRKLYMDLIKYKRDQTPTYGLDDIEVLATDGNYYSNKIVKYADRKLPKSLEKAHHFIHIHVKQNITTIKNWLGVERFHIQLKLLNSIGFEQSMEYFTEEINDIKVAILSTIDLNKTNVDKVKRMHIIPCIEVEVEDTERNQILYLEDFYFVEETRDFYMKIPDTIQSIEQLRGSDGFASAMVEMFKQLLTLEIDSNLIELLISKDRFRKREKIAEVFGIDCWNEAYELLFKENATTQLVLNYCANLGASDNTLNMLNNIDFTYVKKDLEISTILNALKEIKMDVEQLNELSELIRIDVREYWQRKIKDYIAKTYELYCNKLFSKLAATEDKHLQNTYLEAVYEYQQFSVPLNDIPNTAIFDYVKVIQEIFPTLAERLDERHAKLEYNSNYDSLNPQNECADEIANNDKVKLMIYFNRKNEFANWLAEMKQNLKQAELKAENNIYQKFANVVPQKVDISFSKKNSSTTPSTRKGKFSSFTKSDENKRNAAKKIAGNKGEFLIYNLLCSKYGEKNVFPRSEAFVDLGILKPGQAISGQYDIGYRDSDDNLFYAEVKTSIGNSFIITPGELAFAKQNPDKFKLYLVTGIDSELPSYIELPLKFWEQTKNFRMNEVISKIEVEF